MALSNVVTLHPIPSVFGKTRAWTHFIRTSTHKIGKAECTSALLGADLNKHTLGNGRNTVSRVLFRKREVTLGKLGEFCERLGEFAFAHTHMLIGGEELAELSPRNSVRATSSLSSVFETVLSETVFGPSPTLGDLVSHR